MRGKSREDSVKVKQDSVGDWGMCNQVCNKGINLEKAKGTST